MSILVIGSVALDSIQTPFGKRANVLGGSATYFSVAASFFNNVDMIAVVGSDFPGKYLDIFKKRNIGTCGIEVAKGRTFRWKGRYDYDLNRAITLSTHLNVFQNFDPVIPPGLKNAKYLFLANIDPLLQHKVLLQSSRSRLVACDSMNYWIEHRRAALMRLLGKINILLLNDSEARQLSGEANLIKAAKYIISNGPKAVVIKKGEHGVVYFSKNSHFLAPAYPLESVYDPTGAGDTFAGGMIGYLSRCGSINESNLRKSIVYGSILASFVVEDFGVKRLLNLSFGEIRSRYERFRMITKF